jgi:hypothetical protein
VYILIGVFVGYSGGGEVALTKHQLIVAWSPYRARAEDLYQVMEVLSADREELLIFGKDRLAVVLEIQKAAVSRRIPIPPGYQEILLKIDQTPGEGWHRRSEFELP